MSLSYKLSTYDQLVQFQLENVFFTKYIPPAPTSNKYAVHPVRLTADVHNLRPASACLSTAIVFNAVTLQNTQCKVRGITYIQILEFHVCSSLGCA